MQFGLSDFFTYVSLQLFSGIRNGYPFIPRGYEKYTRQMLKKCIRNDNRNQKARNLKKEIRPK